MSLSVIISIIGAVVALVAYIVRLEQRLSFLHEITIALEKRTSEEMTLIHAKMGRNDDIFNKLRDDMSIVLTSLRYIEKRVDELGEKK